MRIWRTQEPISETFAAAWESVVRPCTHSHFAMERAYLEWEAAHGRHAIAILDEADVPMAIVARDEGGTLISGWPWRWQVGLAGGADATIAGVSPADAERAERLLLEAGGGARLRLHLPVEPTSHAGSRAGATILHPLIETAEPFKKLSGNKRREARKAGEAGWTVEIASSHAEFRRFAGIQRETESRREGEDASSLPSDPAPGESWREWEHPWMWLLVAKRDGEIHAGSGFGRSPGGMLDYRTNASTLEAKNAGVNVLLAVEAMRLGREAGHTYMNWGGTTTFKRTLGGATLDTWQWLGGGGAWTVPNRIESLWKKARSGAAARVKEMQKKGKSRR